MFGYLKKIIEKIKNLSSSVDEYKKDTVIQSLPSLTYVNRAKKFLEKNRFVEAEAVLLKALELPQKEPLVYKYLGAVYEKLGNHELAVENYQISADLNPHDKVIWQRLGFSLITIGKYEQAEKSFENANKVQAGNTDTFTGWGMALMKQQKYSEAREKFSCAAKINKYNFSAVFLCAVMEIKLEMYDKAEAKLAFLANAAPNESNTFEFARLKALKDDYDSAIHYAKKSIEFNSKMMPAYILLGQIYSYRHDEESSLKYFNLGAEQGFDNPQFYLEWGKVLAKFEKYDEAKEKFLKYYDEENVELLSHLGLCYVSNKEFEAAKPLLEKVIEKEPENKIVKQALAIIAYEQDEIDRAIAFCRTDDEDAVNCYYLAKCYEKQNNDTKARECYEAALLHNPKYLTAFIDYAKYLISLDDFAEAQRKLRKALKVYENNIVLLNLMFYCSYKLAKDNGCEYNIKETLAIACKIEETDPGLFEYYEQKEELVKLLKEN